MTEKELSREYFKWMCQLVCGKRYSKTLSYRRLLTRLNEIEFTYLIDLDGNRAEDGINLRYHFGYENGYDSRMIASYLDDCPCSVLEMMVALAVRCEEHIMADSELGDRTGQWFWNMIVSLGLGSMMDSRYDEEYVDSVIYRFLNREYERNGKGGLFTIEHCPRDLRGVEIWYQMSWYLNDFV